MDSTTDTAGLVTALRLQVKSLEYIVDELIGSLQECTASERRIESVTRGLSKVLRDQMAKPDMREDGNAHAGLDELGRQLDTVRKKLQLRRQQLAVEQANEQARQNMAARAAQDAAYWERRRQADDQELERSGPAPGR